jgi:hypothetical protein
VGRIKLSLQPVIFGLGDSDDAAVDDVHEELNRGHSGGRVMAEARYAILPDQLACYF